MTPYGIDPARIQANRPAARTRRWWAQTITVWILAVVIFGGPIILGAHIERLLP